MLHLKPTRQRPPVPQRRLSRRPQRRVVARRARIRVNAVAPRAVRNTLGLSRARRPLAPPLALLRGRSVGAHTGRAEGINEASHTQRTEKAMRIENALLVKTPSVDTSMILNTNYALVHGE